MRVVEDRSDERLLARGPRDEEAFAAFYRRYERPVAGFFVRATGRGDLAADLTAETFAEALASLERFDPDRGAAAAWLFGIARHVLARSRERGQVEDRARRRLGMPPLALDDEQIARVEAAAGDAQALHLLDSLPPDQREAVSARVLDERDYNEIAAELRCSESVVRKRVSRGLTALRALWREDR
jgi:RNA polymerase sigma factor (sigma-70 family)